MPYNEDNLRKLFSAKFNLAGWLTVLEHDFPAGNKRILTDPQPMSIPEGECRLLGSLEPQGENIGLFHVKVAGSVRRRRVGLRALVRSLITTAGGAFRAFDSALVVFEGDAEAGVPYWRLSLISNMQSRSTAPRRFSYLFGMADGGYRTPLERFKKLLSGSISLVSLMDAFSVESLTREFYSEISDWYAFALDHSAFPNDLSTMEDDRDHNSESLVRLITRMMFVWFLREMGLVPDEIFNLQYIRENVNSQIPKEKYDGKQYTADASKCAGNASGSLYYRLVLQNLFFATLNCRVKNRKFVESHQGMSKDYGNRRAWRFRSDFDPGNADRFEALMNSRVPFVNGGLFDCLDDAVKLSDRLSMLNDNRTEDLRRNLTTDPVFRPLDALKHKLNDSTTPDKAERLLGRKLYKLYSLKQELQHKTRFTKQDCLIGVFFYDGFSEGREAFHPSREQLHMPDYLFFGEYQADISAFYIDPNASAEDQEKTRKKYSNRTIYGLVDILKKYHFTVEENTPLDQDVSLDPELLGSVFENLLASYNPETNHMARNDTGSFYTPKGVVDYMTHSALLEALAPRLPQIRREDLSQVLDQETDSLPTALSIGEEDTGKVKEEKKVLRKAIIDKLTELLILDPACGSGAFPMGALSAIVHAMTLLDPDNTIWNGIILERVNGESCNIYNLVDNKESRQAFLNDVDNAFDQRKNHPDFARKLLVVEHQLFGEDVQSIAMQITKLRCFISLTVDQKSNNNPDDNFGIRPLPNLETRFVAANALLRAVTPADDDVFKLPQDEIIVELNNRLSEVRSLYINARLGTKSLVRHADEWLRSIILNYVLTRGIISEAAKSELSLFVSAIRLYVRSNISDKSKEYNKQTFAAALGSLYKRDFQVDEQTELMKPLFGKLDSALRSEIKASFDKAISLCRREIDTCNREIKNPTKTFVDTVEEIAEQDLFGGEATITKRKVSKAEKRQNYIAEQRRRLRKLEARVKKLETLALNYEADPLFAAIKKKVNYNIYDTERSLDENLRIAFAPGWMFFGKMDEADFPGFDIVIGNPPYMQLQKETNAEIKQLYRDEKYQTYDGNGNMCCIFMERGLELTKPGGVMMMITSNQWLRTGYGTKMRTYLAKQNVLSLIDLGQNVFGSATVITGIISVHKANRPKGSLIQASDLHDVEADNRKRLSARTIRETNAERSISYDWTTEGEPWAILSPTEAVIKQKVERHGTPLARWIEQGDIRINYGIKTGCDEAFFITTKQRDGILSACSTNDERQRTEKIIRKLLRGGDVKRYGYEWADKWLIGTCPSLGLDIADYPAVADWLKNGSWVTAAGLPAGSGRIRLEQTGEEHTVDRVKFKSRKKTGNEWFETQDQIAYLDDFDKPKVIYQQLSAFIRFCYDNENYLSNQNSFFITGKHMAYLTAFLNSSLFKYCFRKSFPEIQGGTLVMSKIFISTIPVPRLTDAEAAAFEAPVSEIQQKWTEDKARAIDQMIFSLYQTRDENGNLTPESLTDEEIATIGFIDLEAQAEAAKQAKKAAKKK